VANSAVSRTHSLPSRRRNGRGIVYVCDPNIDAAVAGTCNLSEHHQLRVSTTLSSQRERQDLHTVRQHGPRLKHQRLLNLISSRIPGRPAARPSGSPHDVAALASLPAPNRRFIAAAASKSPVRSAGSGSLRDDRHRRWGSSCNTPGTGGCYNGIITVATPAIVAGAMVRLFLQKSVGGGIAGNQYDIFSVIEHETDEILGPSHVSHGLPNR